MAVSNETKLVVALFRERMEQRKRDLYQLKHSGDAKEAVIRGIEEAETCLYDII